MLGCQVGLGYSNVAGGQASLVDLCFQNPGPILHGNLGHQTCSVLCLSTESHTLTSSMDSSGPCSDPGPHGGSDSLEETVPCHQTPAGRLWVLSHADCMSLSKSCSLCGPQFIYQNRMDIVSSLLGEVCDHYYVSQTMVLCD